MKTYLLLYFLFNFLRSFVLNLSMRKQSIQSPSLNHIAIIKGTPEVVVSQRAKQDENEKPYIDIYNSNTSNQQNLMGFGLSPEIVEPHIDFINKSPVYSTTSGKAIIGMRNEDTTITSINKETGKEEKYNIHKETPVIGTVTEKKELIEESKVSYDVKTGKITEEGTKIITPSK